VPKARAVDGVMLWIVNDLDFVAHELALEIIEAS
jgi:DNA polymerase IIIc chi subunit